MQNKNREQQIQILAEVLLTNLPNSFYIKCGFRKYNNELVMIAETYNNKLMVIPVKDILDYLLTQYKGNADDINDIAALVGKLLQSIYAQTRQKRMLGFDGVCHYLYHEIDKAKTYILNNGDKEMDNIKEEMITNRSDDLRYYVKHPLVDLYVSDKIELYLKGDETIEPIKEIIEEYNKQIVQAINAATTNGEKYCMYCVYSLDKCKFISDFKHKRLPSYGYDGNFVDLHDVVDDDFHLFH